MTPIRPRLFARLVLFTQLPGLAVLLALGLARYQDARIDAEQQVRWHARALAATLQAALVQGGQAPLPGSPPNAPARLDAAGLQALLAQRRLPARWMAGVVDDTHGPMATRGTSLSSLQGVVWNAAAAAPGEPALVEMRTTGDGPILAGVVPAPAAGWTVFVGVPRDALQAGVWRAVFRDLLPLLALLLVVLALSVQLARRQLDQARLRTELQRVNRAFERELLRATETREQAIARDLHDAIGSALAGIGMLLASARHFAREPEAVALIGKSQEQVRRATQEIRRILRGMMPVGQGRGTLLPGLAQFAAEMDGSQAVRCSVDARGDFTGVPADVGGHLFRIVQEATANALRHGRARHVRIRLAQSGGCCRLTVQDDGRGGAPATLFGPARASACGPCWRAPMRSGGTWTWTRGRAWACGSASPGRPLIPQRHRPGAFILGSLLALVEPTRARTPARVRRRTRRPRAGRAVRERRWNPPPPWAAHRRGACRN